MKLASLRTTPRTLRAAPAVLATSGLRARDHQDRLGPSLDRTAVVSQYRRRDRHGLVSDVDGIGWTEDCSGDSASRCQSCRLRRSAPRCIACSDRGADFLVRCEDGSVAPNGHQWVGLAAVAPRGACPATENRLGRAAHSRGQPHARFGRADTSESRAHGGIHSRDSAEHPPERSDPTADTLRAPWIAAADGGVAIGRKSKDAGVATAGFFTRVAHRVAGSF